MNILIICAHPDDEVLGCGATIAKLSSKNNIYTLILSQGVTARDSNKKTTQEKLDNLKKESYAANKILGVKDVFFEDLPDNMFDSVPLLNIVKIIEKYIKNVNPEIIFTHNNSDLNIDHKITYNALFTAARPVKELNIKKIFLFEILSSTEWGDSLNCNPFIPNVFVNISETLNDKLNAMNCYKSELCNYPHPRSIEGIEVLSKKRGMESGVGNAEAFFLARCIK